MTLSCPGGTKFSKLIDYGLQKANAKNDDNICPLENDASDIIKTDLDKECSLSGFEKSNSDYYKKMMIQFETKCLNKGHCYVNV